MLNTVSVVRGSFRVTVDISNDLKARLGVGRRVQGSRMRNAVPPPTTEDVEEEDTERGVLTRVKPGGVASLSSAEVVRGDAQVSVSAKR